MKMKTGTSRKLRYGGVTFGLTAAIIAIVIIVNVAFSALAQKKVWYTDLTPELEFTLSDNCVSLIKNGDTSFDNESLTSGVSPIAQIDSFREKMKADNPDMSDEDIKNSTMIKIIFCDDYLTWSGEDTALKYVWKTAADLVEQFPDYIKLEFVDILRNPTAVTKYGTGISQDTVIIDFNSEFRVRSLRSFYIFDSDDSSNPWAYNGEKIYVSAIMAVTRSFTPVVCFTVGHGETLPSETLLLTLSNAGYVYRTVDLAKEDIPEDCRLLIISSPMEDFMEANGIVEQDEIEKIEDFLEESNSLMVFMSPELTQPLVNLEEYLEEWGIVFDRKEEGNAVHPFRIRDLSQSYDEAGFTVGGNYLSYGLGKDITEELASMNRKIVFPNVMSVDYADAVSVIGYTETEDGDVLGDYGVVGSDGTYREVYPLFVTSNNATALANGTEVEKAGNGNILELMMISVEDRYVQEDNYGYSTIDQASYVLACGCPEFLSEEMLHGQFGNNMFLEYTLRVIGHEPVPVGLTFRPFGDYEIDTVTTAAATWYTVILTVVPAVLSLGVGIFVIVRRKNR